MAALFTRSLHASIGGARKYLNTEFSAIFSLIVAYGLLISPMPIWAMLFYLTVPILVVHRLVAGWRIPLRDPSIALSLALILWSTTTLIWGYDPSGQNASRLLWLLDGASTLIFFIAWLIAVESADGEARLEFALVLGGVGNAIFAMIRHFLYHPADDRMWGWGISGQPVLGSAIMAVLFVLTLDRILCRRGSVWMQLAALFLFGIFMLLSGAQGPLLAAGICTLYRLKGENWRIWLGIFAIGLITLAFAVFLVPGWVKNTLSGAFTRGSDYHFSIWRETITEISKRPFLGYGPTARLPITLPQLPHPFPHNLYLSLVFYSGIVGLFLFMAMLVGFVIRPGSRRPGRIALCLVPLIVGLTDLGQMIKGPAAMWYIVWVPILFFITAKTEQR